jgi:hypothetical protein
MRVKRPMLRQKVQAPHIFLEVSMSEFGEAAILVLPILEERFVDEHASNALFRERQVKVPVLKPAGKSLIVAMKASGPEW